jgi:very-short-patch-repair endonuclease
VPPELLRKARTQDGVFSRAQALACGYSDRRISAELRAGRWVAPVPGVYRAAAAPLTWRARVWTALLAAGPDAALCGRIAGRVHRIDGVPGYDLIDVAVPLERRPRRVPSAVVHRIPMSTRDVVRRGGVPVTTAERTTVDLARTLALPRATHVIGDALRQGLVVPSRLDREFVLAKGRTGIETARRARRLADPRVEALTEAQLLGIARQLGLEVVPQFEIVVNGRFLARADAAIPYLRVAFEADGYTYHARRDRFERDHERLSELAGAGWLVAAFTPTQLTDRPDWVGRTMLAVAEQAAENR